MANLLNLFQRPQGAMSAVDAFDDPELLNQVNALYKHWNLILPSYITEEIRGTELSKKIQEMINRGGPVTEGDLVGLDFLGVGYDPKTGRRLTTTETAEKIAGAIVLNRILNVIKTTITNPEDAELVSSYLQDKVKAKLETNITAKFAPKPGSTSPETMRISEDIMGKIQASATVSIPLALGRVSEAATSAMVNLTAKLGSVTAKEKKVNKAELAKARDNLASLLGLGSIEKTGGIGISGAKVLGRRVAGSDKDKQQIPLIVLEAYVEKLLSSDDKGYEEMLYKSIDANDPVKDQIVRDFYRTFLGENGFMQQCKARLGEIKKFTDSDIREMMQQAFNSTQLIEVIQDPHAKKDLLHAETIPMEELRDIKARELISNLTKVDTASLDQAKRFVSQGVLQKSSVTKTMPPPVPLRPKDLTTTQPGSNVGQKIMPPPLPPAIAAKRAAAEEAAKEAAKEAEKATNKHPKGPKKG